MKRILLALVLIFIFHDLFSASLIENKKLGEKPDIEWFSMQVGGGILAEGIDGFGILGVSLFTFKWKYGYTTPLELIYKPPFIGVELAVRGGVLVPVNENMEFRIGLKNGINLMSFIGISLDISPHIGYTFRFRPGGWHHGIMIETVFTIVPERKKNSTGEKTPFWAGFDGIVIYYKFGY